MIDVITTAGLEGPVVEYNPRREAISAVRKVLRNPSATEAEWDDALEALTELSKE